MTGKSRNDDNNNNEYSVTCTNVVSNDIHSIYINTMLVPLGQLFKAISFNTNSDIYINSNIDYGNDKDQLSAAILSDAITDTCASNHKNDTSLIYYNSNYNIETNTLEVLLSSVLVLVLVYVLGAVTALVYQSMYTIRSRRGRNVDDHIEILEKTAIEALETGNLLQDGDTVTQDFDFIKQNYVSAEKLLREVKDFCEKCDADDVNSLKSQERTTETIQSMHIYAAVFDEMLTIEDCHLISSPVVAIETGQIKESMSPATKELSEYLESFSNIYNTNTTNNVYISNISNTNAYINNTNGSIKIETPGKFTDRPHLIRCSSNASKKVISPTDLDDFYDFYDDDIENINPNIKASTNANTSITYSIKPISNPILKPKLKPKRPLHTSSLTPIKQLSPSSSVFHNIDKTMLSPKIQRQPAFVFHSTNSTSPIPSPTTSTVKSPFDATKDLCLSVSTNSVRVRSNIGKMMMDERRYADANDIFDSVIETCKFLTQQKIDVENIVTEVNIWKSEIVNTGNIVRIDNDDDYE